MGSWAPWKPAGSLILGGGALNRGGDGPAMVMPVESTRPVNHILKNKGLAFGISVYTKGQGYPTKNFLSRQLMSYIPGDILTMLTFFFRLINDHTWIFLMF